MLENGEFQKTINLFKNCLSGLLKGNKNLEGAAITGVLDSSKCSMLSGLNNVEHYSFMSE